MYFCSGSCLSGKEKRMSVQTKQTLAKITMVLCALSWGVSFVVVKDTLLLIPTNWTLVIRYGIAGLIMALISGKNLFKLNKAEIIYGCLVGGTAYFGMYFQTAGLNYTTPGKSAFITAAYCVMVPFITWIWTKKRPSWQHFAAAFVCIIGIGLYLSLRTGFLQIRRFGYALKCTVGRIFQKREAAKGSITPFQAVCTALAATVGTGNIAGVAGAIVGATVDLGLIWGISDTFNGFMTVPNLVGVFLLAPVVLKLTKEHFENEK